ncbi:GNAT family N-acetyltransferase [Saccharibacillus sp. CPCC 101409]|uniref:GNAT family N-acetyltransferase n=1 Tax=Saccharibacillus sp. CPCC 101409 TaxID=3058041 RepID=UPI002671CA73|nr:GNAT family N-acetyltransferase [Saccharibacillus sp. CPCC 101409]MDO3411174.1 GNAT family N-acetyltransferase [Saccharibacillus sp. CPCC 101409]
MLKKIEEYEIEPYLKLLGEVEHERLDLTDLRHEAWLRRRIHLNYARGAHYIALHDDDNPEAFGIVSVLHEPAPPGIEAWGARAEILQIGVNRSCRRAGIGSRLLAAAERFARDRGVYCLFLMTYGEDYDVIAFYGKNGYIPVASIPDVFGPGTEGNLVLRKVVSS